MSHLGQLKHLQQVSKGVGVWEDIVTGISGQGGRCWATSNACQAPAGQAVLQVCLVSRHDLFLQSVVFMQSIVLMQCRPQLGNLALKYRHICFYASKMIWQYLFKHQLRLAFTNEVVRVHLQIRWRQNSQIVRTITAQKLETHPAVMGNSHHCQDY